MKYLIKDELLVIILSAIAVSFVTIGIFIGWWQLSTVLNYIPEAIIIGIIPLLLWGFRKRIKNTFEKISSTTTGTTTIMDLKLDVLATPFQEQKQAEKEPSFKVKDGIYHYENRSH